MSEWKECTINDICLDVYSGGTPKSGNAAYYGGEIPWLNTKEVNFCRIYNTEKTITQEGYDNSSAKWVPENAVIVAMYGATAGRVAITKIKLTTNQACCNLVVDPQKADYNYVYYYLLQNYAHIASMANGGAQQNLNAGQIKDYKIPLPPLAEQQRIAGILSSLDDKIELNKQINDNLEKQAQALFKNWFIDYAPFGGQMPPDWKEISLRECCSSITDGVHNTVIDDPNGEYFLLSCKNIKGGILSIGSDERKIDKETFDKLRKRTKLAKGDILLSSVGTVGEMLLLNENPENIEFQRSVAIIKANQDLVSPEFLYNSLLSQKDIIVNAAHGAVQQCLFLSDIGDFKTILPTTEYMEKYTKAISPYYEQISKNQAENQRLTTLRDTLLPKLMSGE